MPTPTTPPAAPSTSTESPMPGRPRARCSRPAADATSSTPPKTTRAIESEATSRGLAGAGLPLLPLSATVEGSPAGPLPRLAPLRATTPRAASPTGIAARTRPMPAASTQSMPSPAGPAAETHTLPATRSPATMAPRPPMSRPCRRITEPAAREAAPRGATAGCVEPAAGFTAGVPLDLAIPPEATKDGPTARGPRRARR